MNWKVWSVVIVLLLTVWVYVELPDEKLHVFFCDVGQGDGALITLGYFQAVIDTGAYEDKILKCLDEHIPFWDKKLELVILSHSDKDHIGALPGIKKFYKLEKVVEKASVGDLFRYTNLYFDILKGSDQENSLVSSQASQTNQSSIVVEVRYGDFEALFTGDIDMVGEQVLVSSGLLRDIEVLKVAHHGSKTSSDFAFLEKALPEYSVISVGKKNSYGHPTKEAIDRLNSVRTKILRTDELGAIEVVSDGKTFEVLRKR